MSKELGGVPVSRWITTVVPLLAAAAAMPFVMVWLDDRGLSETVGRDVSFIATLLAVTLATGYFSKPDSSTGEPAGFSERLLRVGAFVGAAAVFMILAAVLG